MNNVHNLTRHMKFRDSTNTSRVRSENGCASYVKNKIEERKPKSDIVAPI